MAEIGTIDEDLVAMLPCNFAGIAEKTDSHMMSYGLLIPVSICVVVVSSAMSFRTYRRPK